MHFFHLFHPISEEEIAMKRKGLVEVDVHEQNDGGITIAVDGKRLVESLNVMEAFITLGGITASEPYEVRMYFHEVSDNFRHHFKIGREAVASTDVPLELVELGGPGTDTMCPLRHPGASVRILRPTTGPRLPIMNWYQCPEGHGHKDWPATVRAAKRLAGTTSQPHVKANRNLQVLDSE